jgi:hypothetical protein
VAGLQVSWDPALKELLNNQTWSVLWMFVEYGNVGWTVGRLCGLVVRVLGYRFGGPGSIPGTTKKKKSNGSGTGSTQTREYN